VEGDEDGEGDEGWGIGDGLLVVGERAEGVGEGDVDEGDEEGD